MRPTVILLVAGLVALAPLLLYIAPQLAGGSKAYTVLSNSMAPAFQAGDFIVTKRLTRDTPVEVGDILTVRQRDDVFVTHRVEALGGLPGQREFILKGDANEDADPIPVPESRVAGIYLFHVPAYGKLVSFASTGLGRFLLIIVPAAIVLVTESWKVAKTLRDRHVPGTSPGPTARAIPVARPPAAAARTTFQVMGVRR